MYRGVHPTFCTACGKPQVIGAGDHCAYCGASAVAAATGGPASPQIARNVFWAIGLCVVSLTIAGGPWVATGWPDVQVVRWIALAVTALVAVGILRDRSVLVRPGSRRDWIAAAAALAGLGTVALGGSAPPLAWDPGLVIAATLAGVVIEEVLLRGVLFTLLRAALGPTAVIVISTGVFMCLRVDAGDAMFALPLGVILGLLRERSASIYPGLAVRPALAVAAAAVA